MCLEDSVRDRHSMEKQAALVVARASFSEPHIFLKLFSTRVRWPSVRTLKLSAFRALSLEHLAAAVRPSASSGHMGVCAAPGHCEVLR